MGKVFIFVNLVFALGYTQSAFSMNCSVIRSGDETVSSPVSVRAVQSVAYVSGCALTVAVETDKKILVIANLGESNDANNSCEYRTVISGETIHCNYNYTPPRTYSAPTQSDGKQKCVSGRGCIGGDASGAL